MPQISKLPYRLEKLSSKFKEVKADESNKDDVENMASALDAIAFWICLGIERDEIGKRIKEIQALCGKLAENKVFDKLVLAVRSALDEYEFNKMPRIEKREIAKSVNDLHKMCRELVDLFANNSTDA